MNEFAEGRRRRVGEVAAAACRQKKKFVAAATGGVLAAEMAAGAFIFLAANVAAVGIQLSTFSPQLSGKASCSAFSVSVRDGWRVKVQVKYVVLG